MINNFKRIVVLAPHTDDGEIGCGGAIAKFIEEGREVYYVAFSTCEESVPEGFPKDILEKELKQATITLGIKPDNLVIYKYPVRYFFQNRQDILQDMLKLREKIHPDLVFMPSAHDIHQDHFVIAQESLRAFKNISLLGYEEPWNNFTFVAKAFVSLQEKHILKKIKALSCYKSQSHRSYMSEDFAKNLAQTRGVQVNMRYAEAFEIIRWIIT